MPKVEVIEVRGVVQTGGVPGPGTVTLDTLGSDTLALISGGSGATTIADGADVAQGAKADAAWDEVAGSPTIVGILKKAVLRLAQVVSGVGAVADAAWTSGNGSVIAVLKAISGTNTTVAGAVASSRMNIRLQRDVATPTAVTIASAGQDSTALDISAWIAGGFLIPSAMTGTSLTYKVSHTTSGHVELRDQYGNVVTTPIAVSTAYPIPAEAAGFNSLIIRSSAAEGATRTINWVRKG
jgi:hypothetical protein